MSGPGEYALDAKSFVGLLGLVESIKAVKAGRKYLYGASPDQTFTREEVRLITAMEASHIGVEAVAAAVKAKVLAELGGI
jgi:hypothetical protein